jgi:hypothetical protein
MIPALPVGFLFQMAGPGRLQVSSTPQKANITVNGKTLSQLTDTTLVVAPGNYRVVITGTSANLNCTDDVQVSTGQTVKVSCP